MTGESVTLKPGVLFVPTASGGILMDLQADRFIALTPVSSAIWGALAADQGIERAVEHIMRAKGVRADRAEALLRNQLGRWESAHLVNPPETPLPLPRPKAMPAVAPGDLPMELVSQEPIDAILIAQLFLAELQYRRSVSRRGLAGTLVRLQGENGTPPQAPEAVMRRLVRNYHALRRAFRQGRMAHDCLFRSLALTAILRRKGVQADLCIGIIDLPFASHAWVEAFDLVLNEESSKREEYTTIGRF